MQPKSLKNTGPKCRSTTTSGRSRRKAITLLTSFAAAFPAKTSASPEKGLALQELGPVFGASSLGSLASYDPATSSWRTWQRCLLGGWEPFSATFPRSGMTRSGTLFQLQPLVRRTDESGSGLWLGTPSAGAEHGSARSERFRKGRAPTPTEFVRMYPTASASGMPCEGSVRLARQRWLDGDCTLEEANAIAGRDVRDKQGKVPAMWPTPRTTDVQAGRGCVQIGNGLYRPSKALSAGRLVGGAKLADAVQMLPTPTAQDASNNGGPSQYHRNSLPLNAVAGGSLNPTWVEWLMGFPLGWTALDALETQSSRRSSKLSGGKSSRTKKE